ncbi:protein CLN8 [Polypterus senegalus]
MLKNVDSVFYMDYFSWNVRCKVISAGFFFYFGVFLISHLTSACLSLTYQHLLAKEKVFWDLAATRAVFGIQSTLAGLSALLIDPVINVNNIAAQEDWSWFNILTATGFFIFENVALYGFSFAFRTFDLPLTVHHFFAVAGYTSLVFWDKSGHYLPMVTLLLEMSTPFTCISWMLLKANYAHSVLWKLNQWVMIHLFHCRIVLTYHMWWVSWSRWDQIEENYPVPVRVNFFTGLTLLTFIINPIWTHKKTLQLLKPVDWNFNTNPSDVNGKPSEKKN